MGRLPISPAAAWPSTTLVITGRTRQSAGWLATPVADDDVLVLKPGGTAVKLGMAFYGAVCLLLLAGVVAGAVSINGERNPVLSIGMAIPLLFMLFVLVSSNGGSGSAGQSETAKPTG